MRTATDWVGSPALEAAAAACYYPLHWLSFVKPVHTAAEPSTYLSLPFSFPFILLFCLKDLRLPPQPRSWKTSVAPGWSGSSAAEAEPNGWHRQVATHRWWRCCSVTPSSVAVPPCMGSLCPQRSRWAQPHTSLPLLPQHQGETVSCRKTARCTPHPPVHEAYRPFTSPFLLLCKGRSSSS